MNNIIVSSYNINSVDNIINAEPDIIITNPECSTESDAFKSLSYKRIEGILYNPARFTELKMAKPVSAHIDLEDVTTNKVIRLAIPKLESNRKALLESMEGADVQILKGNDSLNVFLSARGYHFDRPSKILVKGAKAISHVAEDKDPIVVLDLGIKKPKTWVEWIVTYIRDFLRALSFKLLGKILLRLLIP